LADVQAGDDAPRRSLAGVEFGLTSRTLLDESAERYSFRRIGSPRHEIVDLEPESPRWTAALSATVEAWKRSTRKRKSASAPTVPGGLFERRSRSSAKGLILLYPILPLSDGKPTRGYESDKAVPLVGFAISLPLSLTPQTVAYQVNKVFWDREYGGVGADEEDD